jgi:mannose-1-phosphate guanylyltransferase
MLPPEQIFVITNRALSGILRLQAPRLPEENFICEPTSRNTAPAIGYMLAVLGARQARFIMGIMPCDHYIANIEEFQGLVRAAEKLAGTGSLVTIGIDPTEPNTGYGYLELGDSCEPMVGCTVLRVRRFVEKPDLEKAKKMLAQGGYAWNSGLFFMRSDVVLEEYRRQQPLMADAIGHILKAIQNRESEAVYRDAWETMPNLSIDYAIMENARNVLALPASELGWTDIGNWDALMDLYRRFPALRTAPVGEQYDVGSQSVSVFRGEDSLRMVATVGLGDVIIVETRDAVLICQRGKSQDIRKIVDILQKKNQPHQD